MEMIKKGSVSFKQIEADIDDYINHLDNAQEFKDRFPASNITLIKNLIAGFATSMLYKNHALRDETYLTTAKLSSSVYQIARTFGYDIKRYNAPTVQLQYLGVPTKRNIISGTIFGYWGDYELVYFGEDRILEKLDKITVYVGKLVSKKIKVQYEDNRFSIRLDPTLLESIDDQHVEIYQNDKRIETKKDVEDYVIKNGVVDFSYDPYSTELLIADKEFKYGLHNLNAAEDIELRYLETNGYAPSLTLTDLQINNNDLFVAYDIQSYGTKGQTIEHMRKLAPLFYSTQRRMVTVSDHKWVIEAHSYIRSAEAVRDDGVQKEQQLRVSGTLLVKGTVIKLSINKKDYEIELTADKPEDNLSIIRKAIASNPHVKISKAGLIYKLDPQTNKATEEVDYAYFNLIDRESRDPSELTGLENIENRITKPGVKPGCCTVNIYYVKYNTVEDPIVLTSFEKLELSEYINYYKMITTRIVLIPATVIKKELNLAIDLVSGRYYDEVVSKIREMLVPYELTLNTPFVYSQFLTEAAQIQVLGPDGHMIHPIKSIVPLGEVKDLDEDKTPDYVSDMDEPGYLDKYLKFTKVNITLVDR